MQQGTLPKISVIMSVFNGKALLPRAVESILNQTLSAFEFLIMNDGSTEPDVIDYLSALPGQDSRIQVFHQSNRGLTASLNTLLSKASGNFCARMDGDDCSFPDRLEKQYNVLNSQPDVGLVTCWVRRRNQQGEPINILKPAQSAQALRQSLAHGNRIAHSSVMYRSELIRSLHGYDERLQVAQDYDLWLRLFDVTTFAVIPEILHEYYYNPQSISFPKLVKQRRNIWMIQRAAAYRAEGKTDGMAWALADYQQHQQALDQRFIQRAKDYQGTYEASTGHPLKGWKHFYQALRLQPASLRLWAKMLYCPVYTLKYYLGKEG